MRLSALFPICLSSPFLSLPPCSAPPFFPCLLVLPPPFLSQLRLVMNVVNFLPLLLDFSHTPRCLITFADLKGCHAPTPAQKSGIHLKNEQRSLPDLFPKSLCKWLINQERVKFLLALATPLLVVQR